MDFESETTDNCDNVEFNDSPFLRLPEEMFLHICSFLDVTDIVVSLSRVCRKFFCILQSENIWRSWIAARWHRHFPIVEEEEECMNWKEACYSLETDWKAWSGKLKKCVIDDGHLSDVDAVLFLNGPSKCVTASRDRNIIIWDLSKTTPTVLQKRSAHDGWVWRLKNIGGTLYSSSWDNTIKLWDYWNDLTKKQQFRCDSAVLSVNAEESGILYGGCFKKVYAFDSRAQVDPLFSLEVASKPVLTLDLFGDDLIFGGENKTLTVWDKRTRSLKQLLKLPGSAYPVCSQVLGTSLYIGDRDGQVRIYTTREGTLAEAAVVDVGHKKPVAAMRVTRGSIVTASDRAAKVSLPLKPTFPVNEFLSEGGLVSGVDCCNGHLAVGTASTVEFWFPN